MTRTANAEQGESMVTVGGREVLYRLTRRALQEFKQSTNKSVMKLRFDEEADEDTFFELLWVGVHAANPDMSKEAFDTTVTLEDLMSFTNTLKGIVETAVGPEGNASEGEIAQS